MNGLLFNYLVQGQVPQPIEVQSRHGQHLLDHKLNFRPFWIFNYGAEYLNQEQKDNMIHSHSAGCPSGTCTIARSCVG